MKTTGLLFLMSTLLLTCRQSEVITGEDTVMDIPHILTEKKPVSSDITTFPVYAEHVEWIEIDGAKNLLIQGNLPNPCCHIGEATATFKGVDLHLTLTAWQPEEAVCIQVLKPFSFLYEIPADLEFRRTGNVYINDNRFDL